MHLLRVTKGACEVTVTADELRILNNAMNEVCNGIQLEGEFEKRMGIPLERARSVLDSIQALLGKLARQE
jgi:hypothetical protein